MNVEKLAKLNQLLTPLNQTSGEYQVSVTFSPGSESGYMKFLLNCKTKIYEVEFNNLDEAITKSQEMINSLNPSLEDVLNDWDGEDED